MHISVDILSDQMPAWRVRPAELAETLLSEISMAFSYRLDLSYDRIGRASEEKFGTALTQHTVKHLQSVGKAIVLCWDRDTLESLMDADEAFLHTVRADSFQSLSEEKRGWDSIQIVRSLEPAMIMSACNQISAVQPCDPWLSVAPNSQREAWSHAFADLKKKGTLLEKSAPEAIWGLIRNGHFGTVILPPYAGSIFASAVRALRADGFTRAVSYGRSYLFMPFLDAENETASILSVILSVADYLDTVCGMHKEAFCVRAGLAAMQENAGALSDSERLVDLILQQIRFAGQWLTNR